MNNESEYNNLWREFNALVDPLSQDPHTIVLATQLRNIFYRAVPQDFYSSMHHRTLSCDEALYKTPSRYDKRNTK